MFAQYKARLQLVRQMNITAKHFGMSWHVAGSFIRLLLAGGKSAAIHDSELIFLLSPTRGDMLPDRLFRVMNRMKGELEIAGIINTDYNNWMEETYTSNSAAPFDANPVMTKGIAGTEPIHVDMRFHANMFIAESGMVTFPVLIKAFVNTAAISHNSMHRLATDNIMLGADNIFTMKVQAAGDFDRFNHTSGIALLDRIICMQQTNTVQQLVPFTVEGRGAQGALAVVASQETDACLLLDAAQLRKEGLSMMCAAPNNSCSVVLMDDTQCDEPCPICFEEGKLFVPLRCSHTFCVECLSKHMLQGVANTVGWSACPLCRAQVVL